MKTFSLSRKELEAFASNTLGFQKTALRRMSTLFLGQLLQLQLTGDNALSHMIREIHCLERNQQRLNRMDPCEHLLDGQTQEWVIFKQYNGINYYLTMARVNDGDQSINQRVRDACDFDFPYLQEAA